MLLSLLAHGLFFSSFQPVNLKWATEQSGAQQLMATLTPTVFLASYQGSRQEDHPKLSAESQGRNEHKLSKESQNVRLQAGRSAVAQGVQPSLAGHSIEEGVDPQVLVGYRLALARVARDRLMMAQAVQDFLPAHHGTLVRITLVITGFPGGLPQMAIQHGSGNRELDQQILQRMAQTITLVSLPVSLSGRHFEVLLPIELDVKKNDENGRF